MIKMDSMLLIGSTTKKAGKTTLACSIIQHFCKTKDITAVKITPIEDAIISKDDFVLTEEKSITGSTDSSRFLKAGAKEAFWLKVKKTSLQKGLDALLKEIDINSLIVCESTSLRQIVEPGVFLMVTRKEHIEVKPSAKEILRLADRLISSDGKTIDFDINCLRLHNGKWTIRQKNQT
jgi:molybdopterin-guanine dinucleotide biosynthesis protein